MTWRRGQCYSQDLRDRVLSSVDDGTPVYRTAKLFRVSVSYIYKALDRRRRTGDSGPNPNRGHRPRLLAPAQEQALAARIATEPDITLARLYGRAPRRQRLKAKAPFGHWKTITFVAALRLIGVTAPWALDRAMDGAAFKAYCHNVLAPTLSLDDIVGRDNLPAHKIADVASGNALQEMVCIPK